MHRVGRAGREGNHVAGTNCDQLWTPLPDARPQSCRSTDIIVGFPGETEQDFELTMSLVRDVQYDQVFIFKYSPRRDTPAAAMPDQVPQAVKEERQQRLLQLVNEIAARR